MPTITSSIMEEETNIGSHEFVLWANGELTIEALTPQFKEDSILDQVRLDLAEICQLRNFLNSDKITTLLAKNI